MHACVPTNKQYDKNEILFTQSMPTNKQHNKKMLTKSAKKKTAVPLACARVTDIPGSTWRWKDTATNGPDLRART